MFSWGSLASFSFHGETIQHNDACSQPLLFDIDNFHLFQLVLQVAGYSVWPVSQSKHISQPDSEWIFDKVNFSGGSVKLKTFFENLHDSWTAAHFYSELYDWMLSKTRTH